MSTCWAPVTACALCLKTASSTLLWPCIRDHRDLGHGTQLAQYKTSSSGRNRFCRVGTDYFAAAQSSKDVIHFWTWHKVQGVGL